MNAVLAFLPTLWTIFGDIPKIIAFGIMVEQSVIAIEATGQTGSQKLAAVLNLIEAYLAKEAPQYAQPFETIAADIEAIVNAVVAGFNLFKKAAPAA